MRKIPSILIIIKCISVFNLYSEMCIAVITRTILLQMLFKLNYILKICILITISDIA